MITDNKGEDRLVKNTASPMPVTREIDKRSD